MGLQRSVLLRAAAAALALGAAVGVETGVQQALARGGAERAQRNADVCHEVARLAGAVRAGRSQPEGRPPLSRVVTPSRCDGSP